MNNPKRFKRAFVAYLEKLLQQEKNDPFQLIDEKTIYYEIEIVEKLINDIDFIIKMQYCEA